jgi:hypothetical protein
MISGIHKTEVTVVDETAWTGLCERIWEMEELESDMDYDRLRHQDSCLTLASVYFLSSARTRASQYSQFSISF